ncbi:type II toxin-antitoxin system VapC family toxin [Rhizobium sp. BR 362]|uniref:type II toxin-antitoxin system VapC family toxin n=1 Tax=Rhizobium sp. BR 362 TaxID=3040670 RepID=UPI002F3E944B
MFIDASAIVAILGEEPGYEEIEKSLAKVDGDFYVSPLVKFEATLALARRKTAAPGQKPSLSLLLRAGQAVDAFIEDIGAQEIEISSDIGKAALEASAQYGKAVGHKADLNFGDCLTYACAKILNVGLLYKGNDFALTDIG